jgi:hypothetical protein
MKPISDDLTHCFRHAVTHRRDEECSGCVLERSLRESARLCEHDNDSLECAYCFWSRQ